MEDLPFAKASQVRTDALNSLILGVSMFLSNEGASKVLSLLGVKVSNDTIQRLYDRIEFIDNPDGSEQLYDNKKHYLSGKQYKDQAENRKKTGADTGSPTVLGNP